MGLEPRAAYWPSPTHEETGLRRTAKEWDGVTPQMSRSILPAQQREEELEDVERGLRGGEGRGQRARPPRAPHARARAAHVDVTVDEARAGTAGAVLDASVRGARGQPPFVVLVPVDDALQHVAADVARLRRVELVDQPDALA